MVLDTENKKHKTKNENNKKRRKPNILSRIFLWWMCPVLINGNKREVEEEDLVFPGKEYNADKVGGHLEGYWLEEYRNAKRENRKPKLWKAMLRAYWLSYIPGVVYIIGSTAVNITQPIIFARLLSYWSADSTTSKMDATYYALALMGLNFLYMLCEQHNSLFLERFGMRVKIAVTSLMYRKLLKINQVSINEMAGGKLVNMMSSDVARFDYAFMFLNHLWIIPVQTAVILYLLYDLAGYAPYVGIFGVVILLLPIQCILTNFTATIRYVTAVRTDERIKLMSEIIRGIQIIKMYAWEKPFQEVVKTVRARELSALRKSIFVRSVFLGFMAFSETSIIFLTCLTIVLTGEMVTATTIYPIQQYVTIIEMDLTFLLPYAVANITETVVSLERIQNFLTMPEREDVATIQPLNEKIPAFEDKFNIKESTKNISIKDNSTENINEDLLKENEPNTSDEFSTEISNVNARWTAAEETNKLTLKNISLRVRRGHLCAVIGPVGSGKSSLLQLMLKELAPSEGTVNIKGKISYACQESWLFPATVRENILFGLPYDHVKYKEVCRVCCLLPDFQQFPYGDQSLVGERGVSLSGGQRARINLARAVYREADIYLLDDPLSAVDANVGRMLFEGCINGYLKGRTCVLVTHQIHYLKAADQIVIMNEGTIESKGTFKELVHEGKEFSKLLQRQESQTKEENKKDLSIQRSLSKLSEKEYDGYLSNEEQTPEAEERAKGNLKWDVIVQYLKSVKSVSLIALTVLILVICQAATTTVGFWLSFWTNQVDQYQQKLGYGEIQEPGFNTQVGLLTTGQYLIVYGSVLIALIIFTQFRIISFIAVAVRASANLHDTIYRKLIVTVMRFFDLNPSGRVINRFSKDLGAIDEFLPRSMLETVEMYMTMISIMVLNAVALPWTLIPTAFLMVAFVMLLKWYLNAAQSVKRLEGTTKSPVFGMLNSTITGLSTIRSSNSQNRLLTNFDIAQDLHTKAYYTYVGGSAAFGMYLDAMCQMYLALVLGLFLVVDFTTVIPVGNVGLAISQSLVLISILQMAANFTAEFLGKMTAVERVLEYTELPVEDNIYDGASTPPTNWPSKGNITFSGVYLQYGLKDPPVLKNVNFDVKSGWKVGVVGRTGAGKSSLVSALFRLYNIEGVIEIDGIDTKDISKSELRSRISIIPQEPVLFSATLRYNLDPFDVYSDDDIWRALAQVEIKDAVPFLDFKVSEGGSNFSVGQRQLVCLARAILRSNKILVMDEATANVDPQTDALIQKTIRREFASCTVLTIAHRLNTIMDSDRVLVMDKGVAAEFDHPFLLLSDPNSIFSFMVRETGESMSKTLYDIAKTQYENKKS